MLTVFIFVTIVSFDCLFEHFETASFPKERMDDLLGGFSSDPPVQSENQHFMSQENTQEETIGFPMPITEDTQQPENIQHIQQQTIEQKSEPLSQQNNQQAAKHVSFSNNDQINTIPSGTFEMNLDFVSFSHSL